MTHRITLAFRELTKCRFGISEEELSAAEEKSVFLLYPDGKGLFTGGYELEFWSEVNQERIRVVFPGSLFEDDAQDEVDQEVAS